MLVKIVTRRRRARWVLDVIVLVSLYVAYSLIQGLVPAQRVVAQANAGRLLELEQRLHLDLELSLNDFVASHLWLAQACNYWYATLHFSVSIGVAMWLLSRHRSRARQLMVALYATTTLALVGFWTMPLAPPRLLTGGPFEDTVADFHTWGGWGSSPVEAVANQYAALPSLHMAWSLWCAAAVMQCATSTLVRRLVWLYPAGTLFVILGTGNHWLLDAVAGTLVLGLGFALTRAVVPARLELGRRLDRLEQQRPDLHLAPELLEVDGAELAGWESN